MNSRVTRLKEGIQEVMRAMGFVLGYVPAAIIPRSVDPWIIRNLTGVALHLRPEKEPRFVERMASTLGPRAHGVDLARETRGYYEMLFEGPLARVRGLHRGGWKPEISIDGLEHLRAGQEAGAGTILWRSPFGTSMTVKAGLWAQGISLIHLSQEHHGGSSHFWVSRNVTSPLFCRAESWYVSERVVIPSEAPPTAALKTLLLRLSKDNAVVSIMATNPGAHAICTPLFDGWVRLAVGAPSLAWKAGSTLLPTFAVREGPGRFRVVIDPPIQVDRDLDRKAYVRTAVEAFATRMESAIAQHPGSWMNWGRFLAKVGNFPTREEALKGT